MTVLIDTFVRSPSGKYQNVRDVERFKGKSYMPGAVILDIDGVEILSQDLWDDVDHLWSILVDVADACRTTGRAQESFPSQSIWFRLERLPTGRLLVSVQWDDERRATTADAAEFYRAVATAGLEFFTHHRRLVRAGAPAYEREAALVRPWLEATEP